MKMKIIFLMLCVIGYSLNASALQNQSNFTLEAQEKIHNQTKFRNLNVLKQEQDRIKEIIIKFEILEDSLTGFEDRFIVNKIKREFMNKYLIGKSDLLIINRKINQQIKIKEDKKEDEKIFNVKD